MGLEFDMDSEKMVLFMYDYREKLRRRLTSLLVEAHGRPVTDKIELLNKYEAIIFKELHEYVEDVVQ